jgi:hypothetical protein
MHIKNDIHTPHIHNTDQSHPKDKTIKILALGLSTKM